MTKTDRSEGYSSGDPERRKAREDLLTEEDVCRAIKILKDRKGSTLSEIHKYVANEFDKFKNASSKQLKTYVKKAACKAMQSGRIAKTRDRFLLAGNASDAASPDQQQGTSSKRNRRRRRRRKGPCRVRRTNRPYCSKYKKRCCRRKRKCRASVHRSKKPVCSRYKKGCCMRR